MTDRTLKLLLASIAVALWGFLLRPLFMTTAAHAQEAAALPGTVIVEDHNTVFVVAGHKLNVFEYNKVTGKLRRVDDADVLFQ